MPEIVEIKKYCDLIKKYCINKKVKTIKILKGRYKKHGKFDGYNDFNKELPLKIVDVNSKGKFIYITFEKDFTLYCTLGLSGGWTYKKKDSTIELLGCSIDELKIHLQNQFKEGMTWQNHGEWHIDHIIPCAAFDLSKKENCLKCFNYKNLQPLWAHENLSKSDKIPIDRLQEIA